MKDYGPVDSRGQEIRLPSHRYLIDMARDTFLHECETTPAVMGGLTRGKLEAAVYQVLDGERPSLSPEQFIPFCNYLFWETSIPGRGRSGSFKKGEFLEKTLQVEPGYLSAKGILRPLTGKSECPSCGSVDATFRTYAFAETAKGADFVLTCVDCGHVERGAPAKTDDQNPDLPSFLTCKCQACSSARLQLRALARRIPLSFAADRCRTINRMLKVGLDPRFSCTDLALRGHYLGEMDDWTQRALGLPGKNAKSNANELAKIYARIRQINEGEEEPPSQDKLKPMIVTLREELTPQVDLSCVPASLREMQEKKKDGCVGLALDQHQAVGVAAMLKSADNGKEFLLGDGTGCGKTRQILGFADTLSKEKKKPVLVVTQNRKIIQGNIANDNSSGVDRRLSTLADETLEDSQFRVAIENSKRFWISD